MSCWSQIIKLQKPRERKGCLTSGCCSSGRVINTLCFHWITTGSLGHFHIHCPYSRVCNLFWNTSTKLMWMLKEHLRCSHSPLLFESLVGKTITLCVACHSAQGNWSVTLVYVSGCAGVPWERRMRGLHVPVPHYWQKRQLAARCKGPVPSPHQGTLHAVTSLPKSREPVTPCWGCAFWKLQLQSTKLHLGLWRVLWACSAPWEPCIQQGWWLC